MGENGTPGGPVSPQFIGPWNRAKCMIYQGMVGLWHKVDYATGQLEGLES